MRKTLISLIKYSTKIRSPDLVLFSAFAQALILDFELDRHRDNDTFHLHARSESRQLTADFLQPRRGRKLPHESAECLR